METEKREGDLYKEIRLYGKTFRIRYGYYDEIDRTGKYNDPIPIFPDFISSPVYTEDGYPFVTAIQDTCVCFRGTSRDDGCYGCRYYEQGDELIGVCRHSKAETNRNE